ncbi:MULTISPECIES: sensor histidine kinase [unclassified Microbacterium]|uniref:sensor histidine kinase n=1 Tax=unclassified Microbacterium TaxID=2609290 RepID=UPI00214C24B1|nr:MULTISPECIES: PAS domain-containing sensor histidine kinase [unclassified Microbacterium]MCR2801922.1 PAS domain-containing sensor histidine kinase [Microbacterium sp. zg.Y818]MCR2824232.1 PAS domain-containing sensor histidine kinase [Microbacterium sp. zg.Y909]WIM22821.1 PAS domain-containing sensor histidine kinase [Microbacterium sp. zg-Y818]
MAVAPQRSAPPRNDSAPSTWNNTRTRSIWQWQMVLAVAVAAISVVVALFTPQTFAQPAFGVGVVLLVVISALTLVVPWHRVGRAAVALVPGLDIVAIGLIASTGDGELSILWVFPVAWFATYYTLPWIVAALCEIAVLLAVDTLSTAITPVRTLHVVVVLLALLFIGVTIATGSRRTRAFSRLLERQFSQLARTLRRVEAQEKRAMALFNSIDTALARVDRRGVVRNANHAYQRLYSVDNVSHAHPSAAVEYDGHRGEPLPPDQTLIARAARGELFEACRVWLFDAAGHWHTLDATTSAVDSTPGEPEVTLLSIHDVTATVAAQQEKKTLTSVVSHELRNPLTAIIGHVDLLLDREDLPADVKEKLTVVENAGQRMERLIASVLESYKPAPPAAQTVDLQRVTTASIDAFRPAAQNTQLTVDAALDPGLLVTGDAFRLRQVIDNIVGNAVKYTPRGGHIRVDARRVGDEIRLAVTDTGIGMAPADIDRVYEPYFRAQTARDSGMPGTGLGMVITREIVHEHGGRLELTSALGRGTTVVVSLKAHDEEGTLQ